MNESARIANRLANDLNASTSPIKPLLSFVELKAFLCLLSISGVINLNQRQTPKPTRFAPQRSSFPLSCRESPRQSPQQLSCQLNFQAGFAFDCESTAIRSKHHDQSAEKHKHLSLHRAS